VATADDVRSIALSLAGAVERECDGFDFRVHNRGFIWSYPEGSGKNRVLRTDIAVLFVGDEGEKQALLKGEPDLFADPGWEGWPLVLVRLPQCSKKRLKELITDAWAMRGGDQ
jgi:hypothetical protein